MGPPGPGHLELRCSPDPRGPSGQTCLLWLPSVNREGQLEQLWAPLPCWPQQGAQQARPTAPDELHREGVWGQAELCLAGPLGALGGTRADW